MLPILSVGSLKTSGTTTLALTLASVAAAAEIPVFLIDAARDKDLIGWAQKGDCPAFIHVEAAHDTATLERLVRAARRRGNLAIIDAGDAVGTIRFAARLSDRTLIPVRFSVLSAYAAADTEDMLAADIGQGRIGRDRAFVASAVTAIPSRIARLVDSAVDFSGAARLGTGLMLRAAYEAPFLHGGTIFTLPDSCAPNLDRARAEAASLASEAGILGGMASTLSDITEFRAAA